MTPDRLVTGKSLCSCVINLLKPYYARSSGSGPAPSFSSGATAAAVDLFPPPVGPTADTEEGLESPDDGILRGCLKNSESLANLDEMLKHLPVIKHTELTDVIKSYPCLFANTPSRTYLIEYDIDVGDASPIYT